MSVQPRSAARAKKEHSRSRAGRAALVAGLTAMTAVAVGLIVYFTGTSVAWFATSPTSDPLFGALNACLLRQVPHARGGFAVGPKGLAAAAFDGAGLAVCTTPPPGGAPVLSWLPLRGISSAAWDFKGSLWVATSAADAQAAALWRISGDGPPLRAGEAAIVALAGHADGVVALDAGGKLFSLGADGSALGFAELPRPPPEDAQLAVDVSGRTASVVAGGAVWLYSAQELKPLRAESPCEVEYLWWLPQASRALVACGPAQSWALTFDAHTGARDAAPGAPRERSTLVPLLAAYVRGCEGLPCQTRAP